MLASIVVIVVSQYKVHIVRIDRSGVESFRSLRDAPGALETATCQFPISNQCSFFSTLKSWTSRTITSWSFPLVLLCLPIPLQLRIRDLLGFLLCLVFDNDWLGLLLSNGDVYRFWFRLGVFTLYMLESFSERRLGDL